MTFKKFSKLSFDDMLIAASTSRITESSLKAILKNTGTLFFYRFKQNSYINTDVLYTYFYKIIKSKNSEEILHPFIYDDTILLEINNYLVVKELRDL